MKTTGKRLLALIMSLLLCAGLLPAAAQATVTLTPPTLRSSYDDNNQYYTFTWTAPTNAERVEWKLLYRESAEADEVQVSSGWDYADSTSPWYPTLTRSDMLNEYGPGQYTLYARSYAYDYSDYIDVYSDWTTHSISMEGTRLAAPTNVVLASDGSVSWNMDESKMDSGSYFYVKLFNVDAGYAQMNGTVSTDSRVSEGTFRFHYEDFDFNPSATYYALVQHRNDSYSNSTPSAGSQAARSNSIVTAAADTALPAPSNLRWDAQQQALLWDAVEGACSYTVRYYWDGGYSYGLTGGSSTRVESTSFHFNDNVYRQYEGKPMTFWFSVRAESPDQTQRLSGRYDPVYAYDWSSSTDNRDDLFHETVTLTRPAWAAPTDLKVGLIPYTGMSELSYLHYSFTPVAGAKLYEERLSFQSKGGSDWKELRSGYLPPEGNPYNGSSDILLNGPGTYRVALRAVPSDDAYTNSAWITCDWVYDPATIAAPTDVSWDGDTRTVSFTPSPEAVSHRIVIYTQDSETSEPRVYMSVRASDTSWEFFPEQDAYYRFSAVALGNSFAETAPAESALTPPYYLKAFRLAAPTGLRLDSSASALCWNAVENADYYTVTVCHIPSNQTWTFDGLGQTSLSLGALAVAAAGFSDMEPLQVQVQPVKLRSYYQTITGAVASTYFPWKASLLDPLKDTDGLIPLAADYDLGWGQYYDHDTNTYLQVPGLLNLRFGRPVQGTVKYCIYRASDNSLVKNYYRGYSGDYIEYPLTGVDQFLLDCFDTTSYYGTGGQLVTVEPFAEDDYYFTAQELGDGTVYKDGPVATSPVWHYKPAPEGSELTAPRIVSFQMEPRTYSNPNGDINSLTVRWEDGADEAEKIFKYELEYFFTPDPLKQAPKSIGTHWGFNSRQATVSDYMLMKNGDGVYYVAVRAISADITKWRNSPYCAMAKFDTRDVTEVAAEALDSLTEAIPQTATPQEVRQAVQETVKTMGTDVLELAMLADQNGESGGAGIIEKLAQLEAQAGGPAASSVDENASDKVKSSFPTQLVSVVGASLNAPADAGASVELVIGSPKTEDVIPELYDQTLSVKFSMELTGVEDGHTLAVPVLVTLPIPGTVSPIFLHILHYKSDGSHEEVAPVIFEEAGQTYAQFVLSSFSDFAIMVDKSSFIWDADREEGALSVDFRLETPYSAAGWVLLCAYSKAGQMIGAELSAVAAGAEEGVICLMDAALKSDAFTAKLFFLDAGFRPLAEAKGYPSASTQ